MAALKYKDDHNKIAYLGREKGCEDFTDILGYLDHSPLRVSQYLCTPPIALPIAAAGDDAAGADDAANEDTAAVNEAAGSAAEAPLVPHSPPVSPVREPTPEQPAFIR
ncbi:hypothetical protein Tco_0823295 [Tanacetum coccineum]|uniref:Uncharacterized protein n=1 Tax=Tanacetum coccineum TaxID=301880 RepID=A0ABQ5AIH9_9ASTR